MSDSCPTVRISDDRGGYVIINESDYDEAKHALWQEPGELAKTVTRAVKKVKAAITGEEASDADKSEPAGNVSTG